MNTEEKCKEHGLGKKNFQSGRGTFKKGGFLTTVEPDAGGARPSDSDIMVFMTQMQSSGRQKSDWKSDPSTAGKIPKLELLYARQLARGGLCLPGKIHQKI